MLAVEAVPGRGVSVPSVVMDVTMLLCLAVLNPWALLSNDQSSNQRFIIQHGLCNVCLPESIANSDSSETPMAIGTSRRKVIPATIQVSIATGMYTVSAWSSTLVEDCCRQKMFIIATEISRTFDSITFKLSTTRRMVG